MKPIILCNKFVNKGKIKILTQLNYMNNECIILKRDNISHSSFTHFLNFN